MHVTFFIGNGFDLNAGLQTKYVDFYQYLIKTNKNEKIENEALLKNCKPLVSNSIFQFIEEDSFNNFDNWANFEEKLGTITNEYKIEEYERLVQEKNEIERHLKHYLEHVDANLDVESSDEDVISVFKKSFTNFLSVFEENSRIGDRESLLGILSPNNVDTVKIHIMDFNYTSLFNNSYNLIEKDIGKIKWNNQLTASIIKAPNSYTKVHGSLVQNMILGVSDNKQISSDFSEHPYAFAFIKPEIDKENATNTYKKAYLKLQQTNLYCIYGMSIGKTDKHWWNYIINQLLKKPKKAMIIFEYSSVPEVNTETIIGKIERDKVYERLLKNVEKLSDEEKSIIISKVFIVFNSKIIFNLSSIPIEKSEYVTKEDEN